MALYCYGGGWVIGSHQAYDSSARALIDTAGTAMVLTGYRLATNNKFAAAHDDTFTTFQWVRANARQFNGDPFRVAVVGESAGGNMAASIAIRARAQWVPLPLVQVLTYPVTNHAFVTPFRQVNQNTSRSSTKSLRHSNGFMSTS